MESFLNTLLMNRDHWLAGYLGVLRWIAPVLTGILLLRCFRPLLTFRRQPEIWAWLKTPDDSKIPVTHWENVIGRSAGSDIRVDSKSVSRNHAVLTRYDDGSWTITDIESQNGTWVNGERVSICPLTAGDVIQVGQVQMELIPITHRQEIRQSQIREKAASGWDSVLNLMLLTIFQCLACLAFLLQVEGGAALSVLKGFGGLVLTQWILLIFYAIIRRASFEVETIAFFLSTMGMCAICTVNPGEAMKQTVAMILGVVTFLVLGWSLRDLERAKRIRYLAVVAGVGFLVITLLFGKEYYGAKNWQRPARSS